MKKFNYVIGFTLTFLLACLSFVTRAQAEVYLVEKLDLDKDGQITIKEAVAEPAVLAAFGKIDTDGNGKISQDELKKHQISAVEQRKRTAFE